MLFVLVADDLDIIIRTLGSMQTNALRVSSCTHYARRRLINEKT